MSLARIIIKYRASIVLFAALVLLVISQNVFAEYYMSQAPAAPACSTHHYTKPHYHHRYHPRPHHYRHTCYHKHTYCHQSSNCNSEMMASRPHYKCVSKTWYSRTRHKRNHYQICTLESYSVVSTNFNPYPGTPGGRWAQDYDYRYDPDMATGDDDQYRHPDMDIND